MVGPSLIGGREEVSAVDRGGRLLVRVKKVAVRKCKSRSPGRPPLQLLTSLLAEREGRR